MNSELIKFTEVKHKRLLKATTMEREKLIFAENSYNLFAVVVGAFKAYNKKLTTKLLCSSPIFLLGWFGSFALQNLQAFSNNKVTNVNVCTKNKSNFILRELYFIFEVVSVL